MSLLQKMSDMLDFMKINTPGNGPRYIVRSFRGWTICPHGSFPKLLKFGQVWLKFGTVSATRATGSETLWSDKKDCYCSESSGIENPSIWKILLFEAARKCEGLAEGDSTWNEVAARSHRRGEQLLRFENELLKNSITHGKAREGTGHGNGGASSDWSSREEIASRLVIITPLTQLPLPPIVLPIIFVNELLATKSPSIPILCHLSFIPCWLASLVPSTPSSVFILSTSISSFRVSAILSSFGSSKGRHRILICFGVLCCARLIFHMFQ